MKNEKDIINAANTRKPKLSLRGRFALIPSLILTIPFLLLIGSSGVLIWIVAKLFKFFGLLDAISYQLEIIQNTINIQKIKSKR